MQEICFEIVELEAMTYHPLVKAEFPGLNPVVSISRIPKANPLK